MQVVVISNLYPNSQEPTRGIFTEQLVQRLCTHVEVRVIAPIPWRMRTNHQGMLKPLMTQVPRFEQVNGVDVWHPRYMVIPKIARASYGFAFYLGIYVRLKKMHQEKPIDLINVHWVYPDGIGAVLAARALNIPVVMHALGCDINEFGHYPLRRQQIRWALNNADFNVFVSKELLEQARGIGLKHERNRVILNGVDQTRFQPGDRPSVRAQLGLPVDRQLVLFAGNFNVEKGLRYLIDAWHIVAKQNPNARLVVVGSGPEQQLIDQKIASLGLGESILMLGRQTHDKMPFFLQATDILCLPSLREGCPNVVLEALSSSAVVVASRVGAVPDLVDESRGILVQPQQSQALAEALNQALTRSWPHQTWQWQSWDDNALKVLEAYGAALERS